MYSIKNRFINITTFVFLYCLLTMVSFSCVNTKKITYFQDISDTSNGSSIPSAAFKEPIIQPDDILSISILTIDPLTSLITNQVSGTMPSVGASSAASTGQQVITGFLVDKDGFIELSMIGKVNLKNMTTFEARELIRKKCEAYLKNTVVNVRFANFKITVLGEVARPATYTMPNEKVTLIDAIGLAGDLTIYGKRKNVLLIRDNEGKKEFARFDLNSSKTFESPYFYLRQNDVVYVEPTKAKVASLNMARTQNITIIGAALSVLIVLISRIN